VSGQFTTAWANAATTRISFSGFATLTDEDADDFLFVSIRPTGPSSCQTGTDDTAPYSLWFGYADSTNPPTWDPSTRTTTATVPFNVRRQRFRPNPSVANWQLCLEIEQTYTVPNPQCAAVFNPALCATEVRTYDQTVATVPLPSIPEHAGPPKIHCRRGWHKVHRKGGIFCLKNHRRWHHSKRASMAKTVPSSRPS
jgi:hypothetical protein